MSGHGGRRDSRKKAQREEREQDDEQEELQRRRSSGSAGGGILSFLKTELDSFVRGLSGKGDDAPADEEPRRSTAASNDSSGQQHPAKKRQKRSHEAPPLDNDDDVRERSRTDPSSSRRNNFFQEDLDRIRQHTARRYSTQDYYYPPLTAANLHASTSQTRIEDLDHRQQNEADQRRPHEHVYERFLARRDASAAYPSASSATTTPHRITSKPLPPTTSSPHRHLSSPTCRSDADQGTEAQLVRRRKRERAATFVNDEAARLALAKQFGQRAGSTEPHGLSEVDDQEREQAREQAARQQKRKERERAVREARRRQERAEALARLEAQQAGEHGGYATGENDATSLRTADLGRRVRLNADAGIESDRPHGQQRSIREEERARRRQQEEAQEEERIAAEAVAQARVREMEKQVRLHRAKEKQAEEAAAAELERVKREEQERQEKLRLAAEKERRRVAELEAEVQRLKKELEAAKEQNERAARHVQFASRSSSETQSAAVGPDAHLNSTTSGSLLGHATVATRIPPPAPCPPPPPPLPAIPASARATPTAIIAARKAALKSTPPRKKPPHGIGVAMPVDMAKFLSEMKNTKLRKVGPPASGTKPAKKDDEENSLKHVLENVLKKRFKPHESGPSSSGTPTTATSDGTFSNRDLSASTSSSITSFSSYRPLDWSFELDKAPLPPPRPATALDHSSRQHLNASASMPSLPVPPRPRSLTLSSKATATHLRSNDFGRQEQLSRGDLEMSGEVRHSDQMASSRTSADQHRTSAAHSQRSSGASRPTVRPHVAFGHALTTEEPQRASRSRAQPYAHHRTNSHQLTASTASVASAKSPSAGLLVDGLPQPHQRQPSQASADKRSNGSNLQVGSTASTFRSAGSSFDVDIYAKMHLKEEEVDDDDADMRRSLSDPPRIDGTLDLPSPTISLTFLGGSSTFGTPRKVSTSKIPRSDSLQALQTRSIEDDGQKSGRIPINETLQRQTGRKISDGLYTHPRPAPAPPLSTLSSNRQSVWQDSLGRPLSPAKTRTRWPLHATSLDEEEEYLLGTANVTDAEAAMLLEEIDRRDVHLVGYGTRS